MLSTLKLFLLCCMCTIVVAQQFSDYSYSYSYFSENFRRRTIFNWRLYYDLPGDKETLADFSQLEMTPFFEPFSYRNHENYLTGKFTLHRDFDNSYKIRHFTSTTARIPGEENLYGAEETIYPLCEFFSTYYQINLLPIGLNHTDFPPNKDKNACPIKAGTYTFSRVNNLQELIGKTRDLYYLTRVEIRFAKDDEVLGGFGGQFEVLTHYTEYEY